MSDANQPTVHCILGPTNTGKTSLGLERMITHPTGVMGFPLRLLARENYDRLAGRLGTERVALVTGEERIIPERPDYFLCTVEAMPLERDFAFVGVDEIQLCEDHERGHIFTDRLLYARGTRETLFLGAATIAPLVELLLPHATIESRPRLSTLSFAGHKKVTKLPPRTAAVAFSVGHVYALADLIRAQRGGAAVVLGALSPKTRNAQVELYQDGKVDYLVATDAIGMGLNMDISHVAFASRRKFDGQEFRDLTPAELAQIAGRAGRAHSDGTFGSTADCDPFDDGTVRAIEQHRFPDVRNVWWRNRELDFSSVAALEHSLQKGPPKKCFVRKADALDHRMLEVLGRDDDIRGRARGLAEVSLLWDVCQVPDFRKTMSEQHQRLLARVFQHLIDDGRIPEAWIDEQLKALDDTDGDPDALMARISHVRTWSYIAYRKGWLDDGKGWQGRARALEDRLSEALHARLTQRFVDRLGSTLARRTDAEMTREVELDDDGAVKVAGTRLGRLSGFRLELERGKNIADEKKNLKAARRALREVIANRVSTLEELDDKHLVLEGRDLFWDRSALAEVRRGDDILRPEIRLFESPLLEPEEKKRVDERLKRWLDASLQRRMRFLTETDPEDTAPVRAVRYALRQGLGAVPRRVVREHVDLIKPDERYRLKKRGMRIGYFTVWVEKLGHPDAIKLRATLDGLWHKSARPPVPLGGEVSMPRTEGVMDGAWLAIGFYPVGDHVFRIDMLERVASEILAAVKQGPCPRDVRWMSLLGCGPDALEAVLDEMGYRTETGEDGVVMVRRAARKRRGPPRSGGPREGAAPREKAAPREGAAPREKAAPRESAAPDAERTGEGEGEGKRRRKRRPRRARPDGDAAAVAESAASANVDSVDEGADTNADTVDAEAASAGPSEGAEQKRRRRRRRRPRRPREEGAGERAPDAPAPAALDVPAPDA